MRLIPVSFLAVLALAGQLAAPGPFAVIAMGETTSLFEAAADNDAETVCRLIAAGADLEARNSQGRTALLVATHRNAVGAARLLIEAGADVNAMDDIDDSPFLYAGADLKSTNRYGGTALIPAAHHGHVETVRELLDTDIPIDHVNHLGWTALLEAVILGDGGKLHTEIVRLLVEAGADAAIADRDGATPLQHAERAGYDDIVGILRGAR